MIRTRLADLVRPDDGCCCDCGESRGSTWVRTWRIRIASPSTLLVPLIERRCYDCWIEHDIEDVD